MDFVLTVCESRNIEVDLVLFVRESEYGGGFSCFYCERIGI